MNARHLTNRADRSHKAVMRKAGTVLVAMLGCGSAGGCINVTAPDKPIVIQLDINVKQEVVYRLAPNAKSTIEENSSIF